MIFEQDFTDFVQLLNDHQVKYMVVGAYALSFHGRPRHTGDLDIWIKPDAENAGKMINVIAEFGFGQLGLTKDDFLRKTMLPNWAIRRCAQTSLTPYPALTSTRHTIPVWKRK